MKVLLAVLVLGLCSVDVESQFWKYPQQFLTTWLRQGKTATERPTTPPPSTASTTYIPTITITTTTSQPPTQITPNETRRVTKVKSATQQTATKTTPIWSTVPISTSTSSRRTTLSSSPAITSTLSETSTTFETTTHDVTGTTEEPRENHRTHDFYLSKREKPQLKIQTNISQNLLPLPAGASAALVKPTKYHYYPHNQHIYLLPECAIQQVCNAVYIRLNWTQPLCACPSRYRDPCSASLNSDDLHTTELMIDRKSKRALTLVKTCEATAEMRVCRSPRDWSLLALQNIRTGKSHYLVICRCPDSSILEGPMSHDQPTYASVPGIRVYGMMCVDGKRRGRPLRNSRSLKSPPFPWKKAVELAESAQWD